MGSYSDIWKRANVVPIHKKQDKQVVQYYRPISLLPICAKIFEKILFKYNFFKFNNLITNQAFQLVIPPLIDFADEIYQAFDSKQSLEIVRFLRYIQSI